MEGKGDGMTLSPDETYEIGTLNQSGCARVDPDGIKIDVRCECWDNSNHYHVVIEFHAGVAAFSYNISSREARVLAYMLLEAAEANDRHIKASEDADKETEEGAAAGCTERRTKDA
jgi:hypothetical protein